MVIVSGHCQLCKFEFHSDIDVCIQIHMHLALFFLHGCIQLVFHGFNRFRCTFKWHEVCPLPSHAKSILNRCMRSEDSIGMCKVETQLACTKWRFLWHACIFLWRTWIFLWILKNVIIFGRLDSSYSFSYKWLRIGGSSTLLGSSFYMLHNEWLQAIFGLSIVKLIQL